MAWLMTAKRAGNDQDEEVTQTLEELIAQAEEEEGPQQTGKPRWWRRWGTSARDVVWAPNSTTKARVRTDDPRDASTWSAGSGLATKAATGALLAGLVCGPLSLGLWAWSSSSSSHQQVVTSGYDARTENRKDAADAAAELFVTSWLQASQTNTTALNQWWDTTQISLPTTGSSVLNAHVYESNPIEPGVWQVTIGADVKAPGSSWGWRYFVVPVAVSGSTNVAAQPLGLPSEVAAPSKSVPSLSTAYSQQVDTSSGIGTSVQGFLSALLTGQGSIQLYERPGVSIPAVSPAPWSSAQVQTITASDSSPAAALNASQIADGVQVNVLVTVNLTTGGTSTPAASGSSNPLSQQQSNAATAQYELSLESRAGRWEITSVTAPTALSTPSNSQSSTN